MVLQTWYEGEICTTATPWEIMTIDVMWLNDVTGVSFTVQTPNFKNLIKNKQ